jgi:hypothetical protein
MRMNKCLVIITEGETELEFYKRFVKSVREEGKRFTVHIEYINVSGVSNFQNDAVRKFVKQIQPKYGADTLYTAALCYDTDVFEFAQKPPVDWTNVEKELRNYGAVNVIHVKAKRSLEDWLLLDSSNIMRFLRLPENTRIAGESGYKKLQNLFAKANKIYFKGKRCGKLVDQLDMKKILAAVSDQLIQLREALFM